MDTSADSIPLTDVLALAKMWADSWRKDAWTAIREGRVNEAETCDKRAAAIEEFAAAILQSVEQVPLVLVERRD